MPVRFPIDPVSSPLTPAAFRNAVRNLLLSYHAADADFLAEIIQNSIDAVEDNSAAEPGELEPKIELAINPTDRTIEIADNGPGIPDDTLLTLGCPNFTTKTRATRRGHKGVGLAFAAWSSREFCFATKRRDDDQIVAGRLLGGFDWIQAECGDHPRIQAAPDFAPDFLHNHPSGTVFRFALADNERLTPLLARLNENGVQSLLRMKTAIGFSSLPQLDTRQAPAWMRRCKMVVSTPQARYQIAPGFLLPHEHFGQNASYDIRNLAALSIERRDRLLGQKKCIYSVLDKTEVEALFAGPEHVDTLQLVRQQDVTAYGAFLDSKRTFKEWNDTLYQPACGVGRRTEIARPGIRFVTATMPAGEILDVDLPFGSGNKDRLFIVVQFRDVKPDIGRKTFERAVVDIGQSIARHLCAEKLVPNRKLLVQHAIPHGETEHEQAMGLEIVRENARNKRNLALATLGFTREPATEQDVVALFSALLGAKLLKGYDVLAVYGSTEKYDAVYQYRITKQEGTAGPDSMRLDESAFGRQDVLQFPPSVLEFKPLLSHLVDNFDDDTKTMTDIRLVVAWDKGEKLPSITHRSIGLRNAGPGFRGRSSSMARRTSLRLRRDQPRYTLFSCARSLRH